MFSHFSRASCFAHTLKLVARKFDTITSVKKVLTKAYCLVAKFNMSSKATEKLIQQAGKKLRANCPTRWSSTFLVVSRILQLRVQVSSVCEEQGIAYKIVIGNCLRTIEISLTLLLIIPILCLLKIAWSICYYQKPASRIN